MSDTLFEAFAHISFRLDITSLKAQAQSNNKLFNFSRPHNLPTPLQVYSPSVLFDFSCTSWKVPRNIGSFCFPEKHTYPAPDYHPKFLSNFFILFTCIFVFFLYFLTLATILCLSLQQRIQQKGTAIASASLRHLSVLLNVFVSLQNISGVSL